MKKQRKTWWLVEGFGKSLVCEARHAAGAVSQFKKEHDLPIKSGRRSGDWVGVTVSPFAKVKTHKV